MSPEKVIATLSLPMFSFPAQDKNKAYARPPRYGHFSVQYQKHVARVQKTMKLNLADAPSSRSSQVKE